MIVYLIILNVIAMTLINGQITLKENAPINITDDDVTPIKDSGEWIPKEWYTIRLLYPSSDMTDFREAISQAQHIVDKTLLIKKFIELAENGTIVINQPFSWGKSFNLEMLRRFFEIEVDEDGVELPEAKKLNKVLFLGGKLVVGVQFTMIPPLKIAKKKDIVDKYLGKYPVILFSFKDVYNESVNTMKGLIATKLLKLYNKEFPYLVKYCNPNDTSIPDLNKVELKNYFTRKVYPDSKFGDSLRLLSRLLKEYFKQKVIVLIDDYDEPIQRALQKYDSESKHFKTILNVIGGMLGAVAKNNPNVERALFTGTFPFNDFGPKLDNLKHYTVLDKHFSKYYGFSEKEVATLLSYVTTNITIQDLKVWYNGFDFTGKLPLYNPLSILQCLKYEGRIERYSVLEDRLHFLQGNALSSEYQRGLQKFFTNSSKFYFYNIESTTPSNDLYYFLIFGGYVAARKENSFGDYYLSIPNYEAMCAYERIQLRWTTEELYLTENWQYTPAILLGSYKIKGFETVLQIALNKSDVLNHLYGPNAAEDGIYYNGLLLSIVSSFPPDFALICEIEPKVTGKIELFFAPSASSLDKDGIIVEYKVSMKQTDRIRVQADLGAKTIDLGRYESRLKQFPYLKNIYKVFIVFRGNEVAVGEHKVPYPKLK